MTATQHKYHHGSKGPSEEAVAAMNALVSQTVTALEDFDDAGKMSFLTILIREIGQGVAKRCRQTPGELVTTLALRVLNLVH